MKYREGDIVRISKKSWCYGFDERRPKDTDGKIVNIIDSRSMRVDWDNGEWYYFSEDHLKLRRRA